MEEGKRDFFLYNLQLAIIPLCHVGYVNECSICIYFLFFKEGQILLKGVQMHALKHNTTIAK